MHVRLFIVHCYQSSKCLDQLVQRALSACTLIYHTLLSEQFRLGSVSMKSTECMYAYFSYIAIRAVRLGSPSMKSADCMYAYLSYIAIRAVNALINLYKER